MATSATRDFSRATLAALACRGVVLVGTRAVPGPDHDLLNPVTYYCLNDNGTSRIRSFDEVLEMAR